MVGRASVALPRGRECLPFVESRQKDSRPFLSRNAWVPYPRFSFRRVVSCHLWAGGEGVRGEWWARGPELPRWWPTMTHWDGATFGRSTAALTARRQEAPQPREGEHSDA